MKTYEVEIKFRVVAFDETLRRLTALTARPYPAVDQEDRYLAHPSRNFAETGEALRLRREGSSNCITYKGPKLGGPAKTREEIEIPCGEGPETLGQLGDLFERLGFEPVAVVRKHRLEYEIEHEGRTLHVALDRAEGLGTFAEVETIAQGPDDLPAAQASVQSLAQTLGLTEVEPRSYLRMLLQAEGRI